MLLGREQGQFGNAAFHILDQLETNDIWWVGAGDLMGNGLPDLVVVQPTHSQTAAVVVLMGDGLGNFSARTSEVEVDFWTAVVADFNRDGKDDLLTVARSRQPGGDEEVTTLLSDGVGGFAAIVTQPTSQALSLQDENYAVGDINGDGIPDLVGGTSDDAIPVYLGDGQGGFAAPRFLQLGRPARSIALGDVNRDGSVDILSGNGLRFRSNETSFSVLYQGSTTRELIAERRYTYEPNFNQLTSEVDALGRWTLYDVDPANGNVLEVRQVVGLPGGDDDRVTRFTYHDNGLLHTLVDPFGAQSEFLYDTWGRLLTARYDLGRPEETVVRYEYDAAGNRTAAVDHLGRRHEFSFDLMNRLVLARDSQGRETTRRYDAGGLPVEKTDVDGQRYFFQFDALGRLVRTFGEQDQSVRYRYDAAGNRTEVILPNGDVLRSQYDSRGRVIRQINADSSTTSFTYDVANNLTSIRDAQGNETRYFYDGRNRRTLEVSPEGGERRYRYDLEDNLIAIIDRNGRERRFTYDQFDRIIEETWVAGPGLPAHRITYEYDLVGRLLAVEDIHARIAYEYDDAGRLAVVVTSGVAGVPELRLVHQYDTLGMLLARTEFLGGVEMGREEYSYDEEFRITGITQRGPGMAEKRVEYTYGDFGELLEVARFGDAAATQRIADSTYEYDEFFRLLGLRHSPASDDPIEYQFEYDGRDLLTQLQDSEGKTTFAYDAASRLRAVDYAFADRGTETFAYDQAGNRVRSNTHGDAYATAIGNRLTEDGTYRYAYDAEGNLVTRTHLVDQSTRTFTWDARNRLTTVVDRNASGALIQELKFTYDPLNRRLVKEFDRVHDDVAAIRTYFLYEGSDVLLEYVDPDGDGPSAAALSMRYFHGVGTDQVLAQEYADGRLEWLLGDHLGSTRQIVNLEGKVIQEFAYLAFGGLAARENEAVHTRYLFTGREYDAESDLYYYRARYYDASLGRFLSQDTFEGGDTNLYTYVYNSPQMYTDPSGAIPAPLIAGLISGSIDVVTTALTTDYRCLSAGDIFRNLAISFGKGFLSGLVGGALGKLGKLGTYTGSTEKLVKNLDNAVEAIDKFRGGVGKVLRNSASDIAFEVAAGAAKGDVDPVKVALAGLTAVPKGMAKDSVKKSFEGVKIYKVKTVLEDSNRIVAIVTPTQFFSETKIEVARTLAGKYVSESVDVSYFLAKQVDKTPQNLLSRIRNGEHPSCGCQSTS